MDTSFAPIPIHFIYEPCISIDYIFFFISYFIFSNSVWFDSNSVKKTGKSLMTSLNVDSGHRNVALTSIMCWLLIRVVIAGIFLFGSWHFDEWTRTVSVSYTSASQSKPSSHFYLSVGDKIFLHTQFHYIIFSDDVCNHSYFFRKYFRPTAR